MIDTKIHFYKLHPWIRKPECIHFKKCNNLAAYQKIDNSKRGTSNYSSYYCEDCKKQEEI